MTLLALFDEAYNVAYIVYIPAIKWKQVGMLTIFDLHLRADNKGGGGNR